ncbi:MAG: nitroreductase family protein [Bacteroidales bacterium]|nr:nitroreductase family protein [Candidatus Cacconaster equifaecalis]
MQMNLAIPQRHSIRQYKDEPLSAEHIAFLQEEIKLCNEEGDLALTLVTGEPEAFKGIGHFSNALNYIVLAAKDAPDAARRVGYYGEQLVLMAQANGLNTCWVAGSYNKVDRTMSVPEGYKLYGVISIGYGKDSGKVRTSKSFDAVTEGSDFPEWFVDGVEAALLAPTAMNRQTFTFSWDGKKVKASAPGQDYEQLSLGIAEYHFDIASGRK